jgi:hypothetical protein
MVGEIKKGKYVYYHCTGYKGKCNEPYTRQEVLEEKFGEVLRGLTFDKEILAWVTQALRESHVDERQCHNEAIARLQGEYTRLQARIDTAYEDKLDGRIDVAYFDKRSSEWRDEQARLRASMAAHETANQTYLEEGVTLLELAHRAHELFAKQEPKEKRRLLDFVLSNSSWANGELSVTYRQPFDIIAQATARNDEEATVIGDPLVNTEIWLPNGACSGRIKSGFVIDLERARKRLPPESLDAPPITKILALADQLRTMIESKGVNQSQLARRFGMTRARVSQILRLHKLHPAIQDYVRNLTGVGPRYLTERRLRPISYLAPADQLTKLGQVRREFAECISSARRRTG